MQLIILIDRYLRLVRFPTSYIVLKLVYKGLRKVEL